MTGNKSKSIRKKSFCNYVYTEKGSRSVFIYKNCATALFSANKY